MACKACDTETETQSPFLQGLACKYSQPLQARDSTVHQITCDAVQSF